DLDRLLTADPTRTDPGGADPHRSNAEPGPDVPRGEPVVEPLVGLRRQIAQRMVTATTTIPHITYVEEVDVTEVEALRATLNQRRGAGQPKLTLLPFLIRAMAAAIVDHPQLNAHVDDDAGTLTVFEAVHVGIATQTDRGLLVPVVRDGDRRSLWGLAEEIGRVAAAARDRSAQASELTGSTITITSLGALGGVVTTPVINKPEVAIVGVNKIKTQPVWDGNQFVPRQVLHLSSSFDHRVIDGFDAASFVQAVRLALQQPALLFIDH
ncbi:MAG: dihydrolipoamide acetyltransferase family protein, partial [Actinomycetota bacterium]